MFVVELLLLSGGIIVEFNRFFRSCFLFSFSLCLSYSLSLSVSLLYRQADEEEEAACAGCSTESEYLAHIMLCDSVPFFVIHVKRDVLVRQLYK